MQNLPKSTYFSIGLLATGLIAFEIILIQIFSITQWYHYAYMVISVAMLGFGVAGTFLSLFEQRFMDKYSSIFPALLLLCGISMALVVRISNLDFFRFDTYLLFTDFQHVGRLILTYLLFFIPFFLAALAIGLTYVRYVRQIGHLYFADLLGSAVGALVGLFMMWHFLPWEIPGSLAFLPVIAGLFALNKAANRIVKYLAVLAVVTVTFAVLNPTRLQLSEFKSISKTLLLPQARIELEKNSPHGLVQVVSSPALRYAPGLSLTYQQSVPVFKVIFNNGDWVGSVIPPSHPDSTTVLDYTTGALPYALTLPERVLVLNAGTGEQVAYALTKGARQVVMNEANPVILSFLRTKLTAENDSLLFHPNLAIHQLEGRTFLYTDTNQYDLIVLPVLSNFGGTSGLYALQEQYLLTREAFGDMWSKLLPDGMISMSTWLDYPVRNPLKILSTLAETLENKGIHNVREHLVGIRGWGTITFLLKKTPFTTLEIQKVRDFCHTMHFDPFLLSNLQVEEQQYNQLQENQFFSHVDSLLSSGRSSFYQNYKFNIQPATDDRPYFSQFIRWKHFVTLSKTFGNQGFPYLEISYFIVMLTFFQILLIALILIFIPLVRLRIESYEKWRILLYFGGIGVGYMFVEVILIQQFILYLGNPIYATAAVISSLLIASGLGSYFSSQLMASRYRIWIAPAVIMLLIILTAGVLKPIIMSTIAWPLKRKLMLLLLIILPLGFTMGIPFPTGMASLSDQKKGTIAWAWGINGYFSVISTVMATIIAIEMGFLWVMMGAAIAYCLSAISGWKILV